MYFLLTLSRVDVFPLLLLLTLFFFGPPLILLLNDVLAESPTNAPAASFALSHLPSRNPFIASSWKSNKSEVIYSDEITMILVIAVIRRLQSCVTLIIAPALVVLLHTT